MINDFIRESSAEQREHDSRRITRPEADFNGRADLFCFQFW